MKKMLYPPSPFRPVYLQCKDVQSPDHRVTDILRADEYTLVSIQTGAHNTRVITELARSLDPDRELGGWAIPFADGPFDLRAFRTAPVAYLQTRHPAMLDIRCFDHYIPRSQRRPWA